MVDSRKFVQYIDVNLVYFSICSTKGVVMSVAELEAPVQILRVKKRDGELVNFNSEKIYLAIMEAFKSEYKDAPRREEIREAVSELTKTIEATLRVRNPDGGVIHLEAIQDRVEVALMRSNYLNIAKRYILHRAQKSANRSNQSVREKIHITQYDGNVTHITKKAIEKLVANAAKGLEGIDVALVAKQALGDLFEGATYLDLGKALTMSARSFVEEEPEYSKLAARLLQKEIISEAARTCEIEYDLNKYNQDDVYKSIFIAGLNLGHDIGIINPEILKFDLDFLAEKLVLSRDDDFTYLGLQTLYDRYFIHDNGKRLELPQAFFMRVAMGLALNETDRNKAAVEFYEVLSKFEFMSSTPTLFNSGTNHSQLSSCFLTTISDDLKGIYKSMSDNALLSKFAGGLGNDWTRVRALGSKIKGTNGQSQGVVPFLYAFNASTGAVNQGGKRKGAVVAYLETWHMDIVEFLELRKNTGDERRRTPDMHTANWLPDLFMERVIAGEDWTLFSPDEVPNLHDSYGSNFKKIYEKYERMAAAGEIRSKSIKAVDLWRKMLAMVFETGHPWMVYKDPCNLRSPQQHVGVVHSSNLCTEITLNTSDDEIAVCNLGSINLPSHIENAELNVEKLYRTVEIAIRMLDNVIDINYYAVPEARNSNMRHRPIGLGLMGFQDALYKMNLSYASEQAVEFADISMEHISYAAIRASSELAKERGSYESFPGSLWDQGILPIDSLKILQKNRGENFKQNMDQRLDWSALRVKIKQNGMRNSNVLAIAPTATISNICGVSQSIEPTYQNLFVKSNMSGEFIVMNQYLVDDLKALGLWDSVMVSDLKYYDGKLQAIERIPEDIKQKYLTAFDIPIRWLVESASRRQKWIDQAQSFNLYMAAPSGKKLDTLYKQTWLYGLKSTYYLRTLGATSVEKSTIKTGALNAVSSGAPQICSLDDPDCEACQ